MAGNEAYSLPSVSTEALFIPNPFYGKVDFLAGCGQDLMAIYNLLDVDDPDTVEKLLNDQVVDGLLDSIVDGFVNTSETKPTMPPMPQVQNLYARISSGEKVLDLGSGDGSKASKCQASIQMCDSSPGAPFVKQFDVNNMEFSDLNVHTSWNALTQFEEGTIKRLENVDGMHVYPDVSYLRREMGSIDDGDYVLTSSGGKQYRDLNRDLGGDELSTGYHMKNTYGPRRIRILGSKKRVKYKPFNVPVRDTRAQMPGRVTPKYDGVAMRLVCRSGLKLLCLRNGTAMVCSGDGPDMDLLLEKLPREGPAEAYVLLRVVLFRGYVPFHGTRNLHAFCRQISLKIGGVGVYPPGHECLQDYPVDGMIYRVEGVDYRHKFIPTVDAYLRTIRGLMEQASLDYRIFGNPDKNALCEYSFTKTRAGTYNIHFVRKRGDKDQQTSSEAIVTHIYGAPVEADDDAESVLMD